MKSIAALLFCILTCYAASAQETGIKDSSRTILITKADRLGFTSKDSTNLTYAAGHVLIIQGRTQIECDSAIYNKLLNTIEAYGNVHINDADSVHTYSQVVKYYGLPRKAYLTKSVRLTDGKGMLMTEELEYDMAAKMATYKNGATIYNGSTKLTSKEGYYYTSTKDAYFKKNVKLEDPKYTMATDTLLYNTGSQLATFVAPTTINDGENIINTSKGFYDLKTGNASFGERTLVKDKSGTVTADVMVFDKKTGQFQAKGNFIRRDTVQGYTIISGESFGNDSTKKYLFTQKPVLIIKQENDSVFITADTIYSGKITDLQQKKKDTLASTKVIDTQKENADSNRYFQAFHRVKIFSDSLQAVGDSLFYSLKDSTFKLFKSPVVWSNNTQISGDTIFMNTRNKKPDQLRVFENSFVINQAAEGYYNQIRSTRLWGYFHNGKIDYIRAKGNAESIYYVQDEDSAFISLNKTEGETIDMRFRNGQLNKVVFRNAVKGTNYPMKNITEDSRYLRGFRWQQKRRPASRAEILGN